MPRSLRRQPGIAALAVHSSLVCFVPTSIAGDAEPMWRSWGSSYGANARVHGVLRWDPDGLGSDPQETVVFGEFSAVGGAAAKGVARWDGFAWKPLGSGLDSTLKDEEVGVFGATVWDPDGAGDSPGVLMVGGIFQLAGGQAARGLARWDGASWQAIESFPDFSVTALATWDVDGAGPESARLAVSSGGVLRVWDGATWQQIGAASPGGLVRALATWDPDGDGPQASLLVAAGGFTSIGGVAANNIAVWDGEAWHALSTGLGGSYSANVVTSWDPDGAAGPLSELLVAGGTFGAAGGIAANRIAAWNGVAWQPLGAGMNSTVMSLSVWDPDGTGSLNARLVAGGNFSMAGGSPANRVASWDGQAWESVGTGVNGDVSGVGVWSADGGSSPDRLVAVGNFTYAGQLFVNRIAEWNGELWNRVGASVFLRSFENWPDARGLVGAGGFERVQQLSDGEWTPSFGTLSADVNDLVAWDNDGIELTPPLLVACGNLQSAGGTAVDRLAGWDGAAWQPIGSGGFVGLPEGAATWDADGSGPEPPLLVVRGSFSSVGGVPGTSKVAAWNGSTWQAFATGVPTGGQVRDITSWDPDGDGPMPPRLVIGGSFSAVGGSAANNIAIWNGISWLPLGSGVNSVVYALGTWDPDGDGPGHPLLVAGGLFSAAGGVPASRIATWNGASWSALGAGVGSEVVALTSFDLDGDGPEAPTLVAGGHFTSAGGSPANRIAYWNGHSWHALGAGLGDAPQALHSHQVMRDGTLREVLLAGGQFLGSAGGEVAAGVAYWGTVDLRYPDSGEPDPALLELSATVVSTDPASVLIDAPLTVSWTVQLDVIQPGIARWVESTYLSIDEVWDPQTDRLLTSRLVEEEFVSAGTFTSSDSLTVPTPRVIPRDYYVILVVDATDEIVEPDETDNVAVSASPVTIEAALLPLGSSVEIELGPGSTAFFRTPTMAQEPLAFAVVASAMAQFAIDEGTPPASVASTAPATAFSISLDNPIGGRAYAAVRNPNAGTTIHVTLSAAIQPFNVTDVQPPRLPSTGHSTVVVRGSRFSDTLQVRLENDESTVLAEAAVVVLDTTTALASFNLNHLVEPGSYVLRILRDTNENELFGPVTVETPAAGAAIAASISAPSEVRSGEAFSVRVDYANETLLNLPRPYVRIVGTDGSDQTTMLGSDTDFLNLLPAYVGERSLPKDMGTDPITFDLFLYNSPDGPFPWDDIAAFEHPEIGEAEWTAIVDAGASMIGGSWQEVADYLQDYSELFVMGTRSQASIEQLLVYILPYLTGAASPPQAHSSTRAMLDIEFIDGLGPRIRYQDYGHFGQYQGTITFFHGQGGLQTIDPRLLQRIVSVGTANGYRVIIGDWSDFSGVSSGVDAIVGPSSVSSTAQRIKSFVARDAYLQLTNGTGEGLSGGPVDFNDMRGVAHSFGNELMSEMSRVAESYDAASGSRIRTHLALNPASRFSSAWFEPHAFETWAIRANSIADEEVPDGSGAGGIVKNFKVEGANPFFGALSAHDDGLEWLQNAPSDFVFLRRLLLRDPDLRTRPEVGGFNGVVNKDPVSEGGQTVRVFVGPNEFYSSVAVEPNSEPVLLDSVTVQSVASLDPNEIIGPAGVELERWVGVSEPLAYTVSCENDPDATAAAAQVLIVQQLDPDLDPATFEFTGLNIAGASAILESGQPYHQVLLDIRDRTGAIVRATLEFDAWDGTIIVLMEAFDPETGAPVVDPSAGVLLPNLEPPLGEASFSYFVRPRPNLSTGTLIDAAANIYFDANDPIETPAWTNTIDADPPNVDLGTIPVALRSIESVEWANIEPGLGASLDRVLLYGSVGGSPYTPIATADAADAVINFAADPYRTYDIVLVGTDGAGNVQVIEPNGVRSGVAADGVSDNVIDLQDFFQWLNWYAAGDIRADADGDGALNASDFLLVVDVILN